MLLHTDPFTHSCFYPQHFYPQTLLHTETFTHRRFYTQTLLHTVAFTHKHFYTQTLLHTVAFTHRGFHTQTQTLLHTSPDNLEIAILPQFLAIEPHFMRKGRDWTREIAISPQFLAIEPRFVRKGCDWTLEIAILLQFLAIEPRFVRKGCISCRLVGTAPAPAFKREIEKKERARGQEGKRRRCEDEKEEKEEKEEKMWGWEDVKRRTCFTDPHYWKNPALRRSREKTPIMRTSFFED